MTSRPQTLSHTAGRPDLPLVRCREATRTFGTGTAEITAVSAVTVEIGPGDRIALIGSSGSGKSTLLHLLAGLESPTSGTVEWPALPEWADHQRPSAVPGIAVVFQGPSLIPTLDVVENLLVPMQLAGVPTAEALARAVDALAVLDLTDLAERLPDELSGGQAQRVAVARALAAGPQLILADEPTGQLDTTTGERVIDALVRAADHTEAGLLITTHDPRVASRMRTLWAMHDGELHAAEALATGASA